MKVGYQSKNEQKQSVEKDQVQPQGPFVQASESDKYVVWHIEGGLGKNVAATALLVPLAAKYPDRKIILVASYPEIFINNPYVYRVYRVGMLSYFYDDFIKEQDTIIFRHEPYFQTDHILKKKHLIQNWADLLSVDYQGQLPSIHFNLVQKQIPANWTRQKPLLVMQTNGGPLQNQSLNYSWTRDMPWMLVNQIADTFRDQYHIIQITRPGSPVLEGVEVIDYAMTNMELFGLVAMSEKRVLIDSSLQHIAAALNLKSTVLWVGTSPNNFGYPIHDNIVAFPPKGNVKLIDAYLFDSSFEGIVHECPYMDITEMFDTKSVIEHIKNN